MLTLKWHGTASVELRYDAGKIIFDPFIPLKGSAVGTKPEDYDGFTDIIITHGHFDHIASLPVILKRNPGARIYCTGAPYRALLRKGLPRESLHRITFGQELELQGFKIKTYHGRHAVLPKATPALLRRLFTDRNAGNLPGIIREVMQCRESGETVLYLLEAEGKTITLMGSMNLREDTQYPVGSDYLILPYNGWEDNFPPAVRVIEALRPAKVLLDHYDDTFPPLTAPLDLTPIIERYGGRVVPLGYKETIL